MIKIKNLNFSYTGAPPYILNNINLNISSGSYVSILGENGSAKSTLVKLILGLIKPLSGSITLNTPKMAYVPQRLETFNSGFPITVKEILKCHMKASKLKNLDIIKKSLNSVGMIDYTNCLIGNMSGGQMQKIFIARALMGEPDLLILDEPSTGIDLESQNEIYSILKHLNTHLKMTIVSVEHNLKAALSNSTHICKLDSGDATLYTIEEYKNLQLNSKILWR